MQAQFDAYLLNLVKMSDRGVDANAARHCHSTLTDMFTEEQLFSVSSSVSHLPRCRAESDLNTVNAKHLVHDICIYS